MGLKLPAELRDKVLAMADHVGPSVRLPVAPPPAGCSEKVFTQWTIDLAQSRGWRVAHFRSVRITRADGTVYFATPVQADGEGFPDLVILRRGDQVAAELKVDGRPTTPAQQEWLLSFRMAGARVFVWEPKDFQEIAEVLQ